MAVNETVKSVVGRLLLDDGTTASGNVRTVNVSMGTLNPDNWDPEKAFTICTLIGQCLSKTLYEVDSIKTHKITEAS